MRLKIVIFSLLVICTFLIAHKASANTDIDVEQGILDLRQTSLQNSVFLLEGDWEFYWKSLLTPEEFVKTKHEKAYISVPSIWSQSSYSGSNHLSNEGYGTYRLLIKLNDNEKDQLMSLYVPTVATSYKIWVNGKLLGEKGKVGTDRKSMKPMSYAEVFSFIPDDNEVEIMMQVSNFSQRKGGMWSSVKFGYHQEISKLREQNMIREIMTSGALLTLSFYFLSHYFFHRITTLPLFLGVFCFLVSLRTFLVGERLLMYLMPSFSWDSSVKLEYLTFYIGFMLLLFYLHVLFPNETKKKVINILAMICLLFSLTTIFPAYMFTHLYAPYQIFLVILFIYYCFIIVFAVLRKREGSLLNLITFCYFIGAVIHDNFYYNFWIISIDLAPIAALIFLFAQAIIIAKKSSYAISQVERLSYELQKTNELLELKVQERTKELYLKNKELQHIEETRKSFFSAVAHEIRTPMQTIQGYIQLIQSKLQPEKEEKFLKIVNEKAKLINHLSKGLLDLAKLDEGQLDFQLEEVDAIYLLEHLYDCFSDEIKNAGITSSYYSPSTLPESYRFILKLDVIKIEQVFSNLIHNAIKFTPAGGNISVIGNFIEEQLELSFTRQYFQLEIKDTGLGIEKSLLPTIFDRFVKGKDPISRQGTGLGLAISSELVKKHNGTLTAESVFGSGSSFFITLPGEFIKMEEG